jgi:hypothetical protein
MRKTVMSEDKPRRRWFSFSLRTLFVLVTIFGVWLGLQVKWMQDRHAALDWVKAQEVVWHEIPVSQGAILGRDAPWQLRLLGESGAEQVSVLVENDERAPRQQTLERLFPEAEVLVLTPGPGYRKPK